MSRAEITGDLRQQVAVDWQQFGRLVCQTVTPALSRIGVPMPTAVIMLLAAAFSASSSPVVGAPAATLEVDNASAHKLWKCSNCPAMNFAVTGSLHTGAARLISVKLAYTILADGSVDDCTVLKKSDPELDDEILCGLVNLEEYEPTAANPERRSVRRDNDIRLGPPGMSKEEMTRDLPE